MQYWTKSPLIYQNVYYSAQYTPPLYSDTGAVSDHNVVLVNAAVPKVHHFTKKQFKHRPITAKGKEEFTARMVLMDWTEMQMGTATESAAALCRILDTLVEECFPEVTSTVKSTDGPWISRGVRRRARRKRRIYRQEGKSECYRIAEQELSEVLERNKKNFFEKMKQKSISQRSSKCYYSAIKMLGSKEAPKLWEIRVMFPGKTDQQIADELATYFNRISSEFVPLPPLDAEIANTPRNCPEMYQIAARLKQFRKPNSVVKGDLPPKLVTELADILAIPLH